MNKTDLLALFVRVARVAGAPETFHRCGERFARDWRRVDVDAATANRLHAEQMLEVTDKQPEDYVPEPEPEPETNVASAQVLDAADRAQAAADAALQAQAAAEAAAQKATADAAAKASVQGKKK